MTAIKLVAGLGNPGPRYQDTRHNVGAHFVRRLAQRLGIALKPETRFKGELGRGMIADGDVRLLIPNTFMNLSGEAVAAVARFFQIDPEEILVAYDEMAFEPGTIRLKSGGGANGHNGILSVIQCLGNQRDFHRLRIGVGHPGSKAEVTAYLTSQRMPQAERELIDRACELPSATIEALISGDLQKAMNEIHAPAAEPAQSDKQEK